MITYAMECGQEHELDLIAQMEITKIMHSGWMMQHNVTSYFPNGAYTCTTIA